MRPRPLRNLVDPAAGRGYGAQPWSRGARAASPSGGRRPPMPTPWPTCSSGPAATRCPTSPRWPAATTAPGPGWPAWSGAGRRPGWRRRQGRWSASCSWTGPGSRSCTSTHRGPVGGSALAWSPSPRAAAPTGLQLWTFQSNRRAHRFYERHGFLPERWTDGATNRERAPDVRYGWYPDGPRPGAATEATPAG